MSDETTQQDPAPYSAAPPDWLNSVQAYERSTWDKIHNVILTIEGHLHSWTHIFAWASIGAFFLKAGVYVDAILKAAGL